MIRNGDASSPAGPPRGVGITIARPALAVAGLALAVAGLALAAAGLALAAAGLALAATQVVPKRALPPEWPDIVTRAFFEDARRVLVGKRPEPASADATPSRSSPAMGVDVARFPWSSVIGPDTLEDEVKAQRVLLGNTVTTPGRFKSGDYRKCRRSFTILAVVFGIISEYDRSVRWQTSAGHLRDQFARAGFNCKVGSDASFQEAKQCRQILDDVVRGERLDPTQANRRPDAGLSDWSQIADRSVLMQRMEQTQQGRLAPWLADQAQFRKQADKIVREAQMLAALAEILQREGMEDGDDETYSAYAKQLEDQALEIVTAVQTTDYDRARQAAGEATKACSECHEGYRG